MVDIFQKGRRLCRRYKQRGKAAVEADNVFHHATYGGATEAGLVSRQERAALEVQINEFGQCPRQIFHSPHAPRLICPVPDAGVSACELQSEFFTLLPEVVFSSFKLSLPLCSFDRTL